MNMVLNYYIPSINPIIFPLLSLILKVNYDDLNYYKENLYS